MGPNPYNYSLSAVLKSAALLIAPKSHGEIKDAVIEPADELASEVIRRMISAFPRDLRRCVSANGEPLGKTYGQEGVVEHRSPKDSS